MVVSFRPYDRIDGDFSFVAIAYISRVQKNQSVLTDYVETKNELHNKLVKEFEGDTLKWQMTIGKDLTMKFKEPTVLFCYRVIRIDTSFQGNSRRVFTPLFQYSVK